MANEIGKKFAKYDMTKVYTQFEHNYPIFELTVEYKFPQNHTLQHINIYC